MDHESLGHSKRGGFITFPFITGATLGMAVASTGMMENVIVYLIKEYNIKSIDAAQASNIVNGCTSLFPVVAAILADSFFGSFMVASISSVVSLLGTIILTLGATLKSLRPQPCEEVGSCKSPSGLQYSVLYIGLALTTIGFGGTRFILATLGANQYDNQAHQSVFFNWFFFTLFVGSVISETVIFYVESDISWSLGFGLCAIATFIETIFLTLGYKFYCHEKPQGSPFVDLARVLVASIREWRNKFDYSTTSVKDYYGAHNALPSTRMRFFNRATLITKEDINSEGKVAAKPWRLCKVQQVEDFKTLIGILPLWTTSIFLTTSISIQSSLVVLQALAMNRHMGPHFTLPPASIPVVALISTPITLTFLDRLVYPTWHKLSGKHPTALQRIGAGHVFQVLSLAISAVVESKRLKQVHNNNNMSMSAFWLCPQLVLGGVGVAFQFPGQVGLYYQEFPESLKSTSTAMISLVIAIGSYLSTAVIGVVRKNTKWLPNDINEGRLDNMYWLLVVIGGINMGYYLVCATLYKYRNQG